MVKPTLDKTQKCGKGPDVKEAVRLVGRRSKVSGPVRKQRCLPGVPYEALLGCE